MDKEPLELIRLLIARLERISVDSYWAHRASGVRGALLRIMDEAQPAPDSKMLDALCKTGFHILERAAGKRPANHSS